MNRRHWLRTTTGCISGHMVAQSAAGVPQNPSDAQIPLSDKAMAQLEAVRDQLTQAKIGPLKTVHSGYYQAIGDAPEAFMKMTLDDCEQIASDYAQHFRALGFRVNLRDPILIVVVFRDDRSFGKFFNLPSLLEAKKKGLTSIPVGLYVRKTNALHVFDWRRVNPFSFATLNMQALVHESTHQLTFSTGLLNREGDTPLCVIEGLGTYGEPREVMGPDKFGRINWNRLGALSRTDILGNLTNDSRRPARTGPRRVPWIPIRELFTDDTILRSGRTQLAYAESWLLVHYLLKDREMRPRFRQYLKAIESRRTADHRVDDAETHLGNLEELDRALRSYAVRLQRPH
jgi:hypothetical protein